MKTIPALALLVLFAVPALASYGQAPVSGMPAASGGASITVTTRLVILDAVVTDAKGNVVPGLTRDDFTILQDGKAQRVRSFEPWTPTPPPPAKTSFDRAGRPDWGDAPLTIFVLDDLNTPFEEKSYSASTLKTYLQRQPATLASPSMLLVVNDAGLHPLASYTRDRDALIHALDHRPGAIPDQLGRGANLELLAESFAVLRQIALSAEGSHAHKNLVWLGRGFPSLDPTQLDDPANAALTAAIKGTVTLLTESRITVYKVDPITQAALSAPTDIGTALDIQSSMGINASVEPPSEDPLAYNFNFNSFVVATGGHYFYGRNDLDRSIADSLQRGSEFYTLSFSPTGAVEGYHTIQIKLKDPSLHVTTRAGYYTVDAQSPGSTPQAAALDLKLAATSTMEFDGVGLHVLAVTEPHGAGKATVNFSVEDRSLTWEPSEKGAGFASKITTVLLALDSDHKIEHSAAAKLNVGAPTELQTKTARLTTTSTVIVDPKTRYLRLIVQDASGRIGTTDIDAKP